MTSIGDILKQKDPGLAAELAVRASGRRSLELRDITIEPSATKHAEGSALITFGDTRVITTVSVEDRIPQFLRGKGEGWLTAEYAMLPRATHTRTAREVTKGSPSGRTHEIQRLIGRSLRSVLDMKALGERTLTVDCDVLQADGGTRTASITGAFVALVLALKKSGALPALRDQVAAVSVGRVKGATVVDLDYLEDSTAEVDMNVVGLASGAFVEVQGTAEQKPFSKAELDDMMKAAQVGLDALFEKQRAALPGLRLKASAKAGKLQPEAERPDEAAIRSALPGDLAGIAEAAADSQQHDVALDPGVGVPVPHPVRVAPGPESDGLERDREARGLEGVLLEDAGHEAEAHLSAPRARPHLHELPRRKGHEHLRMSPHEGRRSGEPGRAAPGRAQGHIDHGLGGLWGRSLDLLSEGGGTNKKGGQGGRQG